MAREFKTPISKLLTEMTSAELFFWQLRYDKEFLGAEREDYRAAMLMSQIANYSGKVLKEGVYVTPMSQMPYRPIAELPTVDVAEQVNMTFTAWNSIVGANEGKR